MLSGIGFEYTPSPSTLPRDTSKMDYKMEFLKMLLTQLRYQDPTSTVESKDMLAQQAQFASLEQMQNLNTGIATLMAQQNVSQAAAMLGKSVTGKTDVGTTISGTVTGIDFAGGLPTLTVDMGGGVTSSLKLPNVTSIGL
jgi:flagellar basal-body rod modification protein FlgD